MEINIIQGDVLSILPTLPDGSVQCVVTSPPYWGLRDYGLEPVIWGGEAGCEHKWGEGKTITRDRQHLKELGERLGCLGGNKHSESSEKYNASTGSFCRHCGAWRGSYGLEPTIELYVEHTVMIFREVKRVLRNNGVCFINLGDTYAASRPYQVVDNKHRDVGNKIGRAVPQGLKQKDLCGIPWRVALALQADGWYLRSDIIWAKPNPMPESCTDRPTTAHEHIFLLTKSAKYYWDQEAVREDAINTKMPGHNMTDTKETYGPMSGGNSGLRDMKAKYHKGEAPTSRNLRSVWTIATAPFPGSHFAVFPPAIPERCIKAGTSEKGCCPKCGAPWVRVVEKTGGRDWRNDKMKSKGIPGELQGEGSYKRGQSMSLLNNIQQTTTTGWSPTCTCNAGDPIPCAVLDPFSGAGTTALVAAKLGRDAIGIELNPEYVEMSRKRIFNELEYTIQREEIILKEFIVPPKKGFIF